MNKFELNNKLYLDYENNKTEENFNKVFNSCKEEVREYIDRALITLGSEKEGFLEHLHINSVDELVDRYLDSGYRGLEYAIKTFDTTQYPKDKFNIYVYVCIHSKIRTAFAKDNKYANEYSNYMNNISNSNIEQALRHLAVATRFNNEDKEEYLKDFIRLMSKKISVSAKRIIDEYYSLNEKGFKKKTFVEIGKTLGCSRQNVCDIILRFELKVKNELIKLGLDIKDIINKKYTIEEIENRLSIKKFKK